MSLSGMYIGQCNYVMAKLLTAIAPLNMEVIIYSVPSQTHIIYTLINFHLKNFKYL